MQRAILGSLLLLLLLAPAWSHAAEAAMPHNAILMGWDGAHRDHVRRLLDEGKLPNLQKLIAAGTIVDIDVISGATDTKAGWTQILTGYRPEITGVFNNGRYRDVPAGYSVFERLRAAYGAERIATVAVIGKKSHCGEVNAPFKTLVDGAEAAPAVNARPRKGGAGRQPGTKKNQALPTRILEENGAKYRIFDGSPYYTMHNNVDQWHFGLTLDEKVGDVALQMLDQYGQKPFFFFMHCAEVDHAGHQHGEPSKEYDEAIISGDRQLGRIVEKLKALRIAERTLIHVTADHGFDVGGKGHRNAPYVFLATNDAQIIRGGARTDITPTLLDRLGVDLTAIRPPLDGESLARPASKPLLKPEDNPDIRRPKGVRKGKRKVALPAS